MPSSVLSSQIEHIESMSLGFHSRECPSAQVVVAVFRTGCINKFGIIVDAASVEGANVDGAYWYIDWLSVDKDEVDADCTWWLKGKLGLRKVGALSRPNCRYN